MSDFTVVLTERATRDLDQIQLRTRLRVVQEIASLARDPVPPPPGSKKLKGYRPPLYRLRVSDFRVLYRVAGRTVTVIRAIDRRDLDRKLDTL